MMRMRTANNKKKKKQKKNFEEKNKNHHRKKQIKLKSIVVYRFHFQKKEKSKDFSPN